MSRKPPVYIAVVDDDESLCRSFARLLSVSGFQPITYPSAESFLADTKHPQFDCLVLDVHLQGMSGVDLRKQLVSEGSQVPVIFITAQDNPHVRDEAVATGCVDYFRKTEATSSVIEAIRKVVA